MADSVVVALAEELCEAEVIGSLEAPRDRLVGKLDATADRRAGVLRVDAVHEDVPFDSAVHEAVLAEIQDLADWLQLEVHHA